MNHLLLSLVAMVLTACAFSTLDKGLPLLVGKPIDAAVNVLGLPNQKMEIGSYSVMSGTTGSVPRFHSIIQAQLQRLVTSGQFLYMAPRPLLPSTTFQWSITVK
jgi:hypothetical protein